MQEKKDKYYPSIFLTCEVSFSLSLLEVITVTLSLTSNTSSSFTTTFLPLVYFPSEYIPLSKTPVASPSTYKLYLSFVILLLLNITFLKSLSALNESASSSLTDLSATGVPQRISSSKLIQIDFCFPSSEGNEEVL